MLERIMETSRNGISSGRPSGVELRRIEESGLGDSQAVAHYSSNPIVPRTAASDSPAWINNRRTHDQRPARCSAQVFSFSASCIWAASSAWRSLTLRRST